MRRFLTAVLVASLAGCAGNPAPAKPPAAFAPGMHGGEPQTDDEKLVAKQLTSPRGDFAAPVTDVEWLVWGPNDPDGTLTTFEEPGKVRIIRVRYIGKPEGGPRGLYDQVFHLGEAGWPRTDNPDGDRWLELAEAKKKAREDEAMKGPHR